MIVALCQAMIFERFLIKKIAKNFFDWKKFPKFIWFLMIYIDIRINAVIEKAKKFKKLMCLFSSDRRQKTNKNSIWAELSDLLKYN